MSNTRIIKSFLLDSEFMSIFTPQNYKIKKGNIQKRRKKELFCFHASNKQNKNIFKIKTFVQRRNINTSYKTKKAWDRIP